MDTPATDLSRLKIERDGLPGPNPSRWRRTVLWGVVGLVMVIAFILYYRSAGIRSEIVEVVPVSVIRTDQAIPILNGSGYVVAQRRAAVASKGTGRLVELRVKEGDRVKKGDILGRLESADMQAALARAQANLSLARADLDRAETEFKDAALQFDRKASLMEDRLVSKADYDAAEARRDSARAGVDSGRAAIKAAEAAVRAAEVDLEYTVIRAPFDGTILTKNADVGEVVAPFGSSASAKAAVVTMADMGSLQVEADVSETNIQKIRPGQRCEITLDAYPGSTYEGRVEAIVPTVDRAKATVLTKIRFSTLDERVLPEMSARVAFLSDPPEGGNPAEITAVPPGAVVRKADRLVVFRYHDDGVEEVPVNVAGPYGAFTEIRDGLSPGDRIVVNPPQGLKTGDRVRISSE